MIRMRMAALHHGSMCLTSCDERSGQGQNTGAKSQASRYANYTHSMRACNRVQHKNLCNPLAAASETFITPWIRVHDKTCEPVWPSGRPRARPVSGRRIGSPFCSKLASVCGHCLVTLSFTINETLWLSSLPILTQESSWS